MDAKDALDHLMQQHGSRLLRLCAMFLRDTSLAQDAVQDTFLKAFRQFHRFRGDADALTWLTAIAINVYRDYRRTAWFRHVDRRMEDLPEQAASFPFHFSKSAGLTVFLSSSSIRQQQTSRTEKSFAACLQGISSQQRSIISTKVSSRSVLLPWAIKMPMFAASRGTPCSVRPSRLTLSI